MSHSQHVEITIIMRFRFVKLQLVNSEFSESSDLSHVTTVPPDQIYFVIDSVAKETHNSEPEDMNNSE